MTFFKKVACNDGYAAITMTILTMVISLTIIGAFTSFTLQEVKTNRTYIKSVESHYISEGGIEDMVYRVVSGKQTSASEILNVGNGATTVTVTTSGTKRTIRSEGVRDNYQQNLETTVDVTTTAVSFYYGVQVGDGGLEMANNSQINGNVYSNGNITGSMGTTITGGAFAASTAAAVNESWEIQNADFDVGKAQGVIIATVDSAGTVGTYNSLALGSDGFGRISYIDDTNKDLKYAQCTNSDCSSSLRTVLDLSTDIDEITSITVGSDGFGRISYYQDTNDDLKLVQCTNDACTTSNINIVDAAGNMGDFSSITMGLDGLPRIGYWDDTNKDVEFAQCTNAACTTKVITTVESSGNVGEYIALKIGSDGFGRMAYYADTDDDLKLIQCTDTACTSKVITIVDATGDVGKHASLALDSSNFAFISYFDDTNNDLKFVRCTNAHCTTKNITTVDSTGTVGEYTSLAIGSDGFARISYYDSSNSALKFARCTNIDCTTRVISTVISTGSVGRYTSLALGADGFGRITFYDATNGDLKFAMCTDQDCLPSTGTQIDVAQSFQPTITDTVSQIDLYLKRVGNPIDAALLLIKDSSGSPSTNPADILATGVISASGVGTSYSWRNITLLTAPTLTLNTTYWIVIDAAANAANYFVWGGDSAEGYARGSPKKTANWTTGGWTSLTGDMDFRVHMGSVTHQISDVTVGDDAHAHTIDNVDVGGDANAFTFNNGQVTGNINADTISNCTVNGNGAYNTSTSCTILGSQTTPTTPPADPLPQALPISDGVIQDWKDAAAAGGTTTGDVTVSGTLSLGPQKITGKLTVSNGATLIVTGTLWVVGDIVFDNNAIIQLHSSYGAISGVIISDAKIDVKNGAALSGSGNPSSFLMALAAKNSTGEEIINVDNNSTGAIYYAGKGWIKFSNNAEAKEATAYGIRLDNNAVITYDSGLASAQFSSGPGGGYDVQQWREVQ
ncbi:MAG: hypothetical protein U1A25_00030 [Candidatus Sungbacteria bacterium]|nr:hypothetical protein [bacterium]MDZ4260030.1 hypothetical protein [Candidatus Sungbacteria bacterium]